MKHPDPGSYPECCVCAAKKGTQLHSVQEGPFWDLQKSAPQIHPVLLDNTGSPENSRTKQLKFTMVGKGGEKRHTLKHSNVQSPKGFWSGDFSLFTSLQCLKNTVTSLIIHRGLASTLHPSETIPVDAEVPYVKWHHTYIEPTCTSPYSVFCKPYFNFYFVEILEVELRELPVLDKCSTTDWAMFPAFH